MNPALAMLAMEMERTGNRLDANETGILAKALEQVSEKALEIQYAKLRSAEFIPFKTDMDPGTEVWKYATFDEVGMAKIVANHADDIPFVDVVQSESAQYVVTAAAAYGYTVVELMRAAKSNTPLPTRKAALAAKAIARKIDTMAAIGDDARAIKGLLNHPNITSITATNGNWDAETDAALILFDLFDAEQRIIDAAGEDDEGPDTLLLPPAYLGRLKSMIRSTGSDQTVLEFFLAHAQTIKKVASWRKLNTTGTSGTPRAIMYKNDPTVLEFELPLAFEQMPPQVDNLSYKVPCLARIGGLAVYQPLKCAYIDVIST